MTECESRSAGSRKGWKCQLVRGHPGPHQNDAWDSLDEWKDPEPPSPSDTTEQVRKLREALEIFRSQWHPHHENLRIQREGIKDPKQIQDPETCDDYLCQQARTALVESEAGKVKAIRTCNKCGYVGPLVLHPPCPYMSCIVPEAVGTLDEALSQEVVLQKRIEELKGGLKAGWNVANLAANGNIKMKSIIAEQKERIAELERRLTMTEQLRVGEQKIILGDLHTTWKKAQHLQDQLSPSPCGVKGHCKVDWTERRAGERRGNAVPGIEDRRKYGSGGSWLERRITSLGPPCARCEEVRKARDEERKHVDTVVMQRIEILTSCVAELEGRLEKAVTDALEAAVVRFEFVALEYCERWKVMPKQFTDKGTAAIRGKAVKR